METTAESVVMPEKEQLPQRRVGTFTLGLTLLLVGGVLLAATLLPERDLAWCLRLCPLILICLGVETLLANRKTGRIKYDWAGILLCFLLSAAALGLCAASWGLSWWEEYGEYYMGARTGNQSCLLLDYQRFNSSIWQTLELEAGDVLEGQVIREAGTVSAYVMPQEDGTPVFQGQRLETGTFRVEIPEDGVYEVCVYGRQAAGSFRLQKAAEGVA